MTAVAAVDACCLAAHILGACSGHELISAGAPLRAVVKREHCRWAVWRSYDVLSCGHKVAVLRSERPRRRWSCVECAAEREAGRP